MYTAEKVLMSFGVCSLSLVGILIYLHLKARTKDKHASYIKSIRIYPIKGTKAVVLDECEVVNLGPKYDRQFVLLTENGLPMSISNYPKMCLVQAHITPDCFTVEAPNMNRKLHLPLAISKSDSDCVKTIMIRGLYGDAAHVSDEADKWFQEYLGVPTCQLFCLPVDGEPRHVLKEGTESEGIVTEDDVVGKGPFLICSESAINELNKNLKEPAVIEQFRPSIIIGGCKPFEEETWKGFAAGTAILKRLYPCPRCPSTTLNPDTAKKHPDGEPFKTLSKFHPASRERWPLLKGRPVFGCTYGVLMTGKIRVGDPVYAVNED